MSLPSLLFKGFVDQRGRLRDPVGDEWTRSMCDPEFTDEEGAPQPPQDDGLDSDISNVDRRSRASGHRRQGRDSWLLSDSPESQ